MQNLALWAWGSNQNGQLGITPTEQPNQASTAQLVVHSPTLVTNLQPHGVSELVCGDSCTIVRLDSADKVFGWGRGFSLERQIDVSRFKPKELA